MPEYLQDAQKAVDLTRPTPARRDAPLHGQDCSEVREATKEPVADGREVHAAPNKVRHVCERPRGPRREE